MADKDEFFDKKDVADESQETEDVKTEEVPEKIKVGDSEYTPEELDRLVTLGKIGVEAESKFDTKIDSVWPKFQKTINEKKELETKLAEIEKAKTEAKQEAGQELSEEETRKLAREQAKKLGILLDEDFDAKYVQRREAEKLLEDTNLAVENASEKYNIKTTPESLLKHMQETGIKNPDKALKDMFEEQIDKWKEKELSKKKGSGLVTEESSVAGSKTPTETKTTKGNLAKHIREALYSTKG